MNHTPGPWKITKDTIPGEFVTYTKVRDERDGVIAVMHINEVANAHLIASAPELLAALENLLADWERVRGPIPLDHEARSAIAKAKGGAL